MNTRSRFYARRKMFAARRKLLAILKDATWRFYTETRCTDWLVSEALDREDRDLFAEAYYTAREMAHWANLATR